MQLARRQGRHAAAQCRRPAMPPVAAPQSHQLSLSVAGLMQKPDAGQNLPATMVWVHQGTVSAGFTTHDKWGKGTAQRGRRAVGPAGRAGSQNNRQQAAGPPAPAASGSRPAPSGSPGALQVPSASETQAPPTQLSEGLHLLPHALQGRCRGDAGGPRLWEGGSTQLLPAGVGA